MTTQEIKDWYKQYTGSEIPPGWDFTEEVCLEYIAQNSYYAGYNEGKNRNNKCKKSKKQ